MRPAKEFPAARVHFGETSTLELLISVMRYQKLSPDLITRVSHSILTNARYNPFICFRIRQFIHCLQILITCPPHF